MQQHHSPIAIEVETAYLADQSNPANEHYVFAYTVTLRNQGEQGARLLTRHWIITDGKGDVEEVKGLGVVGKQPTLEPGEQFQYSSFCPLPTTIGSMEGWYKMKREDGSEFDARVETFTLAAPYAIN